MVKKFFYFLTITLGMSGIFSSLAAAYSQREQAGMFSLYPSETEPPFHPNDPKFADSWQLLSDFPPHHQGEVSEEQRALGVGVRVDRAWRYHLGRADTVIAVLDSGVYWDESDLRDNFYLNARELPQPSGAKGYDANGDGKFNIRDYELDARVSDHNQNGVIDPGDLIAAFSDGHDADGNGYVDDIAGWDFHEHDNDPYDRVRFGHGNGEAKDSAAMINNQLGQAGVCGHCQVVFLRLNDSFIVDANAFAAAVYYATTLGVDVIQQALGSLNHNPFTQQAINAAYERGVVIIGSAADETSFHHNYPSTMDPIVYTNAIRHDSQDYRQATTFVNFNNCSNYGARVDIATSAKACSSEATGILSGVTALALSYAKSLDRRLKPGEMISLLKNTATDINLGESTPEDPYRYNSWQGWDLFSGYGRTDAHAIVKAIAENTIPPESRITSPDWFALFSPEHHKQIPVHIQVAVPRSQHYRLTLEIARGVETADYTWQEVKSSEVFSEPFVGLFANIPLATLSALGPNPREVARNRYAYTLRLKVDDLEGHSAEARRTIFIFNDPYLYPGFPYAFQASGESSGLFVDLNADGRQEYVFADGAGILHALTYSPKVQEHASHQELAGFPVQGAASRYQIPENTTEDRPSKFASAIVAPIASGPLDNDGKNYIVTASLEGFISAIDGQGQTKKGFPIALPFPDKEEANGKQTLAQGILASPVLADISNDGFLDIIVAAMDGKIYAFDRHGNALRGFPITLTIDGIKAKLVSSPAIYDVDDDGFLDLILGSNHSGQQAGHLFIVSSHPSKGLLAGSPIRIPMIGELKLPTIGTGIPTSPMVGDVDGDGRKEIIIHPFVGKTYILSLDGKLKRSLAMELPNSQHLKARYMLSGLSHPALGDVDGDGILDPLILGFDHRLLVSFALGGKKIPFQHLVGAWNGRSGKMQANFPRLNDDMPLMTSPISFDLDQDGRHELLASSGGYWLHGFAAKGEAKGFPHFTGGWAFASPSIGDFDGDGMADIALTTREGYAFVWRSPDAPFKKSSLQAWLTYKGNNYRTGSL